MNGRDGDKPAAPEACPIYDREAHWPHIERRRPGFDRRKGNTNDNIIALHERCQFCESALKVISAAIAVMMLVLLGLGMWAWNLQENIWRQLLANHAAITNDRAETNKEDESIVANVELNRALSEKNQTLILKAIDECAAQKRPR